jgi:hypothetical protein
MPRFSYVTTVVSFYEQAMRSAAAKVRMTYAAKRAFQGMGHSKEWDIPVYLLSSNSRRKR